MDVVTDGPITEIFLSPTWGTNYTMDQRQCNTALCVFRQLAVAKL